MVISVGMSMHHPLGFKTASLDGFIPYCSNCESVYSLLEFSYFVVKLTANDVDLKC